MKIRKFLKSVAFATSFSLSLFYGNAQATVWTFTTQGTIDFGVDNNYFFGTSTSLAGLSYTDVITIDPTLYSFQFSDSTTHYGRDIQSGTATDMLTVNGVTKTFTWDLTVLDTGLSYLSNNVTQGVPGIDEAQQFQQGKNIHGRYLNNNSFVSSSVNALNLGLNYDQNWSYNVQTGDFAQTVIYSINPNNIEDFFMSGTPTFASINSVPAVPEPENYAMLMAGLSLMGVVARRRNIKVS
jgi:hypothetical protein